MLFDDDEEAAAVAPAGAGGDGDARIVILERELGECKAVLTAQAQRMSELEATQQSLLVWVQAWAAGGGNGGLGGGVGTAWGEM